MKPLRASKLALSTLFLTAALLVSWVGRVHAQGSAAPLNVVTYQTEDGMTIYGTLYLPTTTSQTVGGVILFAEPGWIIRTTLEAYGRALAEKYGMAALTVDHRGNGKSVSNGKLFETFSREEVDKLQLDIRGAIKFLSSQKSVDPKRIGIFAVGTDVNYALLEASRDPSVQALALMSGSVGDEARRYIKSRDDVPIMTIAGGDDKEGFQAMADAFALSKNKDSKFIQGHSGHGTTLFSRTDGLADKMMQWLADNVKAVGTETKITLKTEDGWTLHGRLRMPELAAGKKAPAVAFSHGANHDLDTFEQLTKALVKQGIATITYDRRGRNMDINEKMPPSGIKNDDLDLKAAINFLAAQKSVDGNRIGIVGATAGNQPVFKAALGDARVKTIVCLTLENFTDSVKQYVSTTDVPVFFIASTEDLNTSRKPPDFPYLADNSRAAQAASKNRFTQFLLYDDAGRGSEMLKTKPELEGMIVRWFIEKLTDKDPIQVFSMAKQ